MKFILTTLILTFGYLESFSQVKLYGEYISGNSRKSIENFDRSLRLNGRFYYIIPAFNGKNELYQLQIVNHDFVEEKDHDVADMQARSLVELLENKFGSAKKNKNIPVSLGCSEAPISYANWQKKSKNITVDLDCRNGKFLYVMLTIRDENLTPAEPDKFKAELADF
ncbi:MAG: hypothetical protein ACNS62_17285 [Candidatus Cyclobacteriaceae bacterium M3_2C_046]